MMEKLRAKLKNQGGFTLIEMLIVVAIIAILIAVSIPLVANALDKTRHATDAANERAAKAEITVQYLSDGTAAIFASGNATSADASQTKIEVDKAYYYDAQNGRLCSASTDIDAYGQCNGATGGSGKHTDKIIKMSVNKDGLVSLAWVATGDSTTGAVTSGGKDLCGAVKDSDSHS